METAGPPLLAIEDNPVAPLTAPALRSLRRLRRMLRRIVPYRLRRTVTGRLPFLSAKRPAFEWELDDILRKPIRTVRIDKADFERFKATYHDSRILIDDEKLLEYFISYRWLGLVPADVFVDVAAQDCPFALFVRDKIRCRAFRQDLHYMKPGIDLDRDEIGGDASNLPLADGYVSKMSLHNSFEHFEGESDIGFIRESQRVLCPGGKLCIVPLFIGDEYEEDPESGWVDEEGVKHLWAVGAQFARQYDVAQFKARVLDICDNFSIELYRVENAREIDDKCYLSYFAIFQRT